MSASEVAGAVRAEAARAAKNQQPVVLAQVTKVGPLALESLDSRRTLNEDEIILSQAVKTSYSQIVNGDVVVLARHGQTWIAVAVVSDTPIPSPVVGPIVGQVVQSALKYDSGPPSGWMRCDGASLPNTEPYVALRSALLADGSPYGVSGSDPKVPNFNDKLSIGGGPAATRAVGATGGVETVTLTSAQSGRPSTTISGTTGNDSPDHSHPLGFHSAGAAVEQNVAQDISSGAGFSSGGASTRHTHPFSGTAGAVDAASSHTNMPPTVAVTYLIKL